jgi:hypothetical protein
MQQKLKSAELSPRKELSDAVRQKNGSTDEKTITSALSLGGDRCFSSRQQKSFEVSIEYQFY